MAESTIPTYNNPGPNGAFIVTIAWQAAAGGTHANYAIPAAAMKIIKNGGMYLYQAITIPSGVTAPAANYDLTVIDTASRDLFDGNLANRSDTVTEYANPANTVPQTIYSDLTVTFANLGANGIGTLILQFARY